MISSWHGGLLAGLTTLLLSCVGLTFLLWGPIAGERNGLDARSLTVFAAAGCLATWLLALPRSSRPGAISIRRNENGPSAMEAEDPIHEPPNKVEFLAMLAHELRNPLAPILHALRILEGRLADDEVHESVRKIAERQVRHLARLVDDLLDVSRLTRGQ